MKRNIFCGVLALILLCVFVSVCAASNASEQAALIAENAKLWKQDTISETWGFTITDLDHNGRQEIISAVMQGSGLYTTFRIFEVNEERDRLLPIEQTREEGSSAPDIMVSIASCYEDEESCRFYYVFDDILRNGYAENYESRVAAFIEDGAWHEDLLAQKDTIYTDETHCTVQCYDAEHIEIDESQYDAIENSVFSDLQKSIVCLNWYMTDSASFDALSYDELVTVIEDLQSGRCVNPAL